jgi:hypothetical protein
MKLNNVPKLIGSFLIALFIIYFGLFALVSMLFLLGSFLAWESIPLAGYMYIIDIPGNGLARFFLLVSVMSAIAVTRTYYLKNK